jgi:hypothetical protein
VRFVTIGGPLLRVLIPAFCVILSITNARAADKPPAQDTVSVDPQTALVIRGALKYLASHQAANGSFAHNEHQAAFTGYALIAFMASGELPNEGEFGKNVANGMSFLLDCERPDGFIAARTGGGNMYGHGICTIALAELYGQTADPVIKPKLEAAVHLILSSQGNGGGWRYAPKINPDADISVTVLQVVALRAAKNAGMKVPQETLDKAITFVKNCHDNRTGGFSYQPHGEAGFARTAAAIYSLQVCGLYDDPYITPASDYLMAHFGKSSQWFNYGNFYAAPAEYMIGGPTWTKWYGMIHDKLMSTAKQLPDGMYYWDAPPGDQPSNPAYATSVAAMILAMPYHYLPLYQR